MDDRVFDDPRERSSATRLVPPPFRPLTATEEQLFATLHSAPSNEEIAARLHISPRTVKFHLTNIRSKLNGMPRLRLCLLSALHLRGLLSLCSACAPVFPKPAAVSPACTSLNSASTFPARQLSVTGGETTDGP
ncbi:helix-turn-helix domain-containing protein [Streptomyces sp. NPDC002932]|uniref:helix-turn-helix domain-containing protein n=1 Tax=Streptomyces sp. NPDC002932 TaxID=3364672 RepID=UPI00367B5B24